MWVKMGMLGTMGMGRALVVEKEVCGKAVSGIWIPPWFTPVSGINVVES